MDVAGLQLTGRKLQIPLEAPAVGSVFAPIRVRPGAAGTRWGLGVGLTRGWRWRRILRVWVKMAEVAAALAAVWWPGLAIWILLLFFGTLRRLLILPRSCLHYLTKLCTTLKLLAVQWRPNTAV